MMFPLHIQPCSLISFGKITCDWGWDLRTYTIRLNLKLNRKPCLGLLKKIPFLKILIVCFLNFQTAHITSQNY